MDIEMFLIMENRKKVDWTEKERERKIFSINDFKCKVEKILGRINKLQSFVQVEKFQRGLLIL